jgi:hypothetical protein
MTSSNSVFEKKESLWLLFHKAIFQGQESGKGESFETQVKLYLSHTDVKFANNLILYENRLLWYYVKNTK